LEHGGAPTRNCNIFKEFAYQQSENPLCNENINIIFVSFLFLMLEFCGRWGVQEDKNVMTLVLPSANSPL
jgi:hypothetical protein